MIGNDIVDLAQAKQESNWQRNGFLNKLFTPHEQQLIQAAADPERMVWLLWSMKESAYKVSIRETGKRVFAPKKLACHITIFTEETAEGVVLYEKAYPTKSISTPQYVSSVASLPTISSNFYHEVFLLDSITHQHQSIRVREKIRQYLAQNFAITDATSFLRKDLNGAPLITLIKSSGEIVTLPISISHHGHYGAFCTHGLKAVYK